MGEYVEIRAGVGEIINIANGLRSRGQQLKSGASGANAEIVRLESGPETLPAGDDFAKTFLDSYHEQVPSSSRGTVPANEAVRLSAEDMGKKLVEIGDFVAGGMFAYNAGDDDNAGDITNAPQQA
jgi:hypothetical protein